MKKMTFKNYYENLPAITIPAFRDKIISEIGFSYETFYRKMREGSFTQLEQEKIAAIAGKPVKSIFSKTAQQ